MAVAAAVAANPTLPTRLAPAPRAFLDTNGNATLGPGLLTSDDTSASMGHALLVAVDAHEMAAEVMLAAERAAT